MTDSLWDTLPPEIQENILIKKSYTEHREMMCHLIDEINCVDYMNIYRRMASVVYRFEVDFNDLRINGMLHHIRERLIAAEIDAYWGIPFNVCCYRVRSKRGDCITVQRCRRHVTKGKHCNMHS